MQWNLESNEKSKFQIQNDIKSNKIQSNSKSDQIKSNEIQNQMKFEIFYAKKSNLKNSTLNWIKFKINLSLELKFKIKNQIQN